MRRVLVAPGRWSPARRELERILDDNQWHLVPRLVGQLAPFVDPRIAARAWFRQGSRNRKRDGDDEDQDRFAGGEQHAVSWGRRWIALEIIRQLVDAGRLDQRGHRPGRHQAWGAAEVQISTQARFEEAWHERYCGRGHARPVEGWPGGRRSHCHQCRNERRQRQTERRQQTELQQKAVA